MPGSSWMTMCFIITCSVSRAIIRTPDLDRVGAAVNLLKHFGNLDLEFRVAPRNDSMRWVFKEDAVYVLKDISMQTTTFDGSTGEFRLEMCRGKNELLESFFRHISIEGVDQPWKAFSRSWSATKESRTLGLSSALSFEVGYILLKLDMRKEEVLITNKIIGLSKMAEDSFNKISVNDIPSVSEFHKKFGTHYIHSYSIGNSLFQVLVYSMADFEYLEKKLTSDGASNMTFAHLARYFSPLFAKEIGQIMVTSGNHNSTVWVNGLMSRKYGKDENKFSSLFSLMWRPWLLEQFEKLESDAITRLRLDLIDRAFIMDSDREEWFKEITRYLIKLSEENV